MYKLLQALLNGLIRKQLATEPFNTNQGDTAALARRMAVSLLLLACLAQFTGCQFFGQGQQNAEPGEEETLGEEDEEVSQSEEHNLFNSGPTPDINNYRPIQGKTSDGMIIKGTLYVPGLSPYKPPSADEGEEEEAASKKAPAPKATYPLIILFHSLSGDRWEWKDLPKRLVNAGYAVLAFDMRGHGESDKQGQRLYVWRQFDKSDWLRMPGDTDALLEAIRKNPEVGMVNTNQVGIIGSSIGANVAVNYAAKHPKQVRAMALLSPGLEYHGIESFNAMTHYENPVFLIASKEDAYASDSAERLYKFALGKKKIKIFQDLGHGTDMLTGNESLGPDIVAWLNSIIPTGQAAPAPVAKPAEKVAEPDNKPTEEKKADTKQPAAAAPKKDAAKPAEKPKPEVNKPAAKEATPTAPPAEKKPAAPAAKPKPKPAPAPSPPAPTPAPEPAPAEPPTPTQPAPLPPPSAPEPVPPADADPRPI